jgi:ATP-dependent Clp protease ATP-binding subunit ClpX
METRDEKAPSKKNIEKEIGEFLAKKFGREVQVISSAAFPLEENAMDGASSPRKTADAVPFDLKPEDLIAHLDQYIVRRTEAKAILATKICTHFNRIAGNATPDEAESLVGRIKNNVLMIGPTGVGKTYMIKLIARKIGVPFVKGDATKFSETGYVGGDVEDLVRDLVREADGDIEKAQKRHHLYRRNRQDRLRPEPHRAPTSPAPGSSGPCSSPWKRPRSNSRCPTTHLDVPGMERFRKTGKRDKNTVNTRRISSSS